MTNYIPFPVFHDDVPIDISFVFEDEKPAGKHGFLAAKGRKFVFEDGTEVKFWGTNLNGAACFPEHTYSEKLARRLAKTGINLVRFHQLDAEWHTPNLFSFVKGPRMTTGHLDARSMERLDYLIYCLKREGIYVYLDMNTYRKFRSDEGVENAHLIKEGGKPYANFSRKLIELQKEFCREIWTHENPYTKLRYCDEPAIVLTEIINESDLFGGYTCKLDFTEPYKTEFVTYFAEWLKANNIERAVEDVDLHSREDKDLRNFKIYLQSKYYAEMMDYMREIGVKIPIAGTNWAVVPDNYRAHSGTDFLDVHPYFYDWRWGEYEKHCANQSVSGTKNSYLAVSGYNTSKDRPTYVSEWDMPWPNEYRAESVIYSAAVGSFQGWSGFAIHTYSYLPDSSRIDKIGEEVSSDMIANVPYRQGVFATWNDPAKFGLFYHAALITRRGDVREGEKLYGVDNPELKWDADRVGANIERYKFATSLDNVDGLEALPLDTDESFAKSDTGELYRSWELGYGTVDTEMTKCAYGSLARNGEIKLSGMTVKCKTDFAVIAMSSLTGDPITKSDNILLTTVGRAQNTDAKFIKDLMVDVGRAPITIENIEAEIELETCYEGMKVWAVSAEGYYIGNVPTEYENGKLKFRLGETSRSMYYLIVKS